MERAELAKRIGEQRAAVAQLRRQLPKPGPSQGQRDAHAAWWLERAVQALRRAEESWLDA